MSTTTVLQTRTISSSRSGRSTQSTTTTMTTMSSNASYYPSMAGPDNLRRSHSHSRVYSQEHSALRRHKMLSAGALNGSRTSSRNGLLRKSSSSASSTTGPQLSAFPIFDPTYEDVVSPPSSVARQDPTPPRSSSSLLQATVKMKPLIRKPSSRGRKSLDLSLSVAENEGMGIYVSSNSAGQRRALDTTYYGTLPTYHTRNTSGNSQSSTNTSGSNHRPSAPYVHPMRQTPQSYTPPISHSRHASSASLPDGRDHSPLLPFTTSDMIPKQTQPRLRLRTNISSSPPVSTFNSSPPTPTSLRPTEPPTLSHTARSSMDSVFRLPRRSRTNTHVSSTSPLDPAQQMAAVQALRAEFAAREAAKDEKYRVKEEREAERQRRRSEKRDESQRRRSDHHERRRTRSTAAESDKSVHLSAVGYESTAALPIPLDFTLAERDWDGGDRYDRPTRRKRRATASSAGKAMSSRWSLFLFRMRTVWLKLKRGMPSDY